MLCKYIETATDEKKLAYAKLDLEVLDTAIAYCENQNAETHWAWTQAKKKQYDFAMSNRDEQTVRKHRFIEWVLGIVTSFSKKRNHS